MSVPYIFSVGKPRDVSTYNWGSCVVRISHEDQYDGDYIKEMSTEDKVDLRKVVSPFIAERNEVTYEVNGCSNALEIVDTLRDEGLTWVFPDDLGLRQQLCQYAYDYFQHKFYGTIEDIQIEENVVQTFDIRRQSIPKRECDSIALTLMIKLSYSEGVSSSSLNFEDESFVQACQDKFDIPDNVNLKNAHVVFT